MEHLGALKFWDSFYTSSLGKRKRRIKGKRNKPKDKLISFSGVPPYWQTKNSLRAISGVNIRLKVLWILSAKAQTLDLCLARRIETTTSNPGNQNHLADSLANIFLFLNLFSLFDIPFWNAYLAIKSRARRVTQTWRETTLNRFRFQQAFRSKLHQLCENSFRNERFWWE